MYDTFVPISVHCDIPFTEQQYLRLRDMPPKPPESKPIDADEVLKANFNERLAGRGVHALRAEMAAANIAIGTGAIQEGKQGSRGMRLATLQKFADFFGCELHDLVTPKADTKASWPFKSITPAQYRDIPAPMKEAAEQVLRAALPPGAQLGEFDEFQGILKKTGT